MSKHIIDQWFTSWETGNFQDIPITDSFTHTSPYGTIKGKQAYLELVANHTEKFLGHQFMIHDILCESLHACVRYTAKKDQQELEVSEWYYFKDGLINHIVAYYNIDATDDNSLDYSNP